MNTALFIEVGTLVPEAQATSHQAVAPLVVGQLLSRRPSPTDDPMVRRLS